MDAILVALLAFIELIKDSKFWQFCSRMEQLKIISFCIFISLTVFLLFYLFS